ncbi:MAG: hypothetical protein AB1Z63_04820 [Candidatus Limnocylindrales bacterium]
MTPIRVITTRDADGSRRVELRCSCVRVGRVTTIWEPLDETVNDLRIEHRMKAPLCRHPWLHATTNPEATT